MVAEDCNTLVANCIVMSCCCQCLLLQFAIFIFVNLRQKTIHYAKKKINRWIRNGKREKNEDHRQGVWLDYGRSTSSNEVLEEEEEGMNMDELGNCIEEVEKVLGELSKKGEFAFGSFWGVENHSSNTMTNEKVFEIGSHVVHFHVIQVVASSLGPS